MLVHTVEICWMNDMQAVRAKAGPGKLSGDALSAAVKAVTEEMRGAVREVIDHDDFFDDDRGVYCPDAEIRTLTGEMQEEDVADMMEKLAETSDACMFHIREKFYDGSDKVFCIAGGSVALWPTCREA